MPGLAPLAPLGVAASCFPFPFPSSLLAEPLCCPPPPTFAALPHPILHSVFLALVSKSVQGRGF